MAFERFGGWMQAVPERGFMWTTAEGRPWFAEEEPLRKRRWLVEWPQEGRVRQGVRRYDPLVEEPTLCRRFATVEPGSEKSILDFADRLGRLGPSWAVAVRGGRYKKGAELIPGEARSLWTVQNRRVRAALALVDALQEGDGRSLRRWFTVRDDRVLYEQPAGREVGRFQLGLRTPLAREGLEATARAVIAHLVNRELEDHALPALMPGKSGMKGPQVQPRNLLGALWLQVAELAGGARQHRQCARCKGWFAVERGRGRSDRVWCSDRCRVAAYEARQERARSLYEKGGSPAEIAKEVGSTAPVVRRWLRGTPRKRGQRG